MHEASLHEHASFVTLTYDEQNCPVSLCYRDYQLFMKRLRKRLGGRDVRFFMCGEYGEALGRPHYHAALFGPSFDDRYVWRDFGSGRIAYRSPLLENVWPFGMSSIGDLTRESAAYIARYVYKKVTGAVADAHYAHVDEDSGEVSQRVPEFCRMSLRPGIGARWFDRYWSDVYPHDRVVSRGSVSKPPRYYDVLLERYDPEMLEDVKERREIAAFEQVEHGTYQRLEVREVVAKARLQFYKRKNVK